jgi:hypothetical protein
MDQCMQIVCLNIVAITLQQLLEASYKYVIVTSQILGNFEKDTHMKSWHSFIAYAYNSSFNVHFILVLSAFLFQKPS